MAGAPKGNNNAGKNKDWEAAIRWVIENKSFGRVAKAQALRAIAETLVGKAIEGDMQAIKEIGDRLDGKAHQSVEATITRSSNVDELTDAVLERIAASGGKGASETESGSQEPDIVH